MDVPRAIARVYVCVCVCACVCVLCYGLRSGNGRRDSWAKALVSTAWSRGRWNVCKPVSRGEMILRACVQVTDVDMVGKKKKKNDYNGGRC